MTDQSAVEVDEKVEVHFKSLVTGERVKFPVERAATLKHAWDKAYKELDEAPREGDTLQCGGSDEGRSLMDDLNLTLHQVHQQQLCGAEAFRYEFKGPSGGAVPRPMG